MDNCSLCPRQCGADRALAEGWCGSDDRIHVASIVIHKGEEPPISGEKGIVNLFFPSCNMQCIYCQNHEISQRGTQGKVMSLDEVCNAIEELLPLSEGNLGFVSPTHFVPQMIMIVNELRKRGHNPVIVYNTNGYDLPETIRSLEGIVDVWLPDFKYSDDNLAMEYSSAPDYSTYALKALKEMVHQCGVTLQTNDQGIAQRGVIVRHLVLPGQVDNSLGVLRMIAEEVSPSLHLSLMSQYYPPENNLRCAMCDVRMGETTLNRKSKIAIRNSQIPHRKSQIANRKSQIANRKSQIANPLPGLSPPRSTKLSSTPFIPMVFPADGCKNMTATSPTIPTFQGKIRLIHK